jgi:molybdate transport system permease protein
VATPTQQHGRWFDRLAATPLLLYLVFVCVLMGCILAGISREAVSRIVRDPAIRHAAQLSFFSSVISTVLCVLVAVPGGYVLSRRRIPFRLIADTILDLPIILPPLVVGLAVLSFFNTALGRYIDRHLIEFVYTWRGIILVQFVVGCAFAVRIMKAGLDNLDTRYENVAMTLGANRPQAFFKVVLPNVWPSVIASAVICWARIFGLFGPILMVCGTMRHRTEILPTSIYLEVSVGNLEAALVIAAFMAAFSMITLLIFKALSGRELIW